MNHKRPAKKYKKQPIKSNKRPAKKQPTKLNQVRIIGGQFKRRNIDFIDLEGLRPTPDRMRETLFNWLMADIYDAKVLDACAGSGVLGFEALSRGASQVVFIEANQQQYQQLQASVKQLGLNVEQAILYQGKAEEVITRLAFNIGESLKTQQPFDLVFLDPPYALNLWQPILELLIMHQLIDQNTLIYLESDRPIDTLFAEGIYVNPIDASSMDANHCHYQTKVLKEKKMGQVHSTLIQIVKAC